ncbi:hypothetical protein BBW68_01130 [Candidatus Erwinia dacicola]|uniref:Uncharacterized protein n=1 Tax=Candidatus Erwinia dacicola TaxID=252393 RepID=A0A1E7Z3L6_9GAMM|nr:hypothetical protein BBW68_01130 [Candidatus Erwinia dacicola]
MQSENASANFLPALRSRYLMQMDLFNKFIEKAKQEVCKAARQTITEKISSKIPTQIDPWGELSRRYLPQNMQQYLPDSSGKDVQINAGADGVNSNAGSTNENSAFPFHL